MNASGIIVMNTLNSVVFLDFWSDKNGMKLRKRQCQKYHGDRSNQQSSPEGFHLSSETALRKHRQCLGTVQTHEDRGDENRDDDPGAGIEVYFELPADKWGKQAGIMLYGIFDPKSAIINNQFRGSHKQDIGL